MMLRIAGATIDQFGNDYKGSVLTEVLVRQGLADENIRDTYFENKVAVDEWAEHVDFSQIARAMAGDGIISNGTQTFVGALLLGVAIGYGATLLTR